MTGKESRTSIAKKIWAMALVMLLVSGGAATFFVWRPPTLSKEQSILIDSLAESVSEVERMSTQVRVALFDAQLDRGEATKDFKRLLDAEPLFACKTVSPVDIQAGSLRAFDCIIFPGGNARMQAEALGDDGKVNVRKFVQSGGGYIGICGGAFLATAKYDWGMALVDAKPLTGQIEVPGQGMVSIAWRGAGTVRMELSDAGGKIFTDVPGLVDVWYSGGPILSPAEMTDLPKYVSLAVFRTEVWDYKLQQGTMIDTPAIVAGRFGKGRVLLFSPHPEMTPGLESIVRRAVLATARTHARETERTPATRRRREL